MSLAPFFSRPIKVQSNKRKRRSISEDDHDLIEKKYRPEEFKKESDEEKNDESLDRESLDKINTIITKNTYEHTDDNGKVHLIKNKIESGTTFYYKGKYNALHHYVEMAKLQRIIIVPCDQQWQSECKVSLCVSHHILCKINAHSITELTDDEKLRVKNMIISQSRFATKEEVKNNTVEFEHPCIMWTGYQQHSPIFRYSKIYSQVYRITWQIANGFREWPKGLIACHRCKTKNCIQESHIHPGTHKQNAQDKKRDGTENKGENHHWAKLSDDDVRQIMVDFKDGILSRKEIAKKYNSNTATIHLLYHGEIRTDITNKENKIHVTKPRLTPEQVLEIRTRIEEGEGNSSIAKEYYVLPRCIQDIRNGKSHKSVKNTGEEQRECDDIKSNLKLEKNRQRLISKCTKVPNPEIGTKCWIFNGAHKGGYGLFKYQSTSQTAHKASYLMYHGDVKKGDIIRHMCKNKLCCSPNHLETGTHAENAKDRERDGTDCRGEKSPTAKITKTQAIAIKKDLKIIPRLKHGEIAKKHAVSLEIVQSISKNSAWKHIIVV
jgi:hypothetical protein